MFDWSELEARQFFRYEIQLPVVYTVKGPPSSKAKFGKTWNVSEGGACLELEDPLLPSTRLALILQAEPEAIEVEAEVVWVESSGPPGEGVLHGVRFTELSREHAQALRTLFPQEEEDRRQGIRLPLTLPVICRIKGAEIPPFHGMTGDISPGGLLLLLPQPLPRSTDLEVTLYTSHGPIHTEGTIVWREPGERRRGRHLIRHGFQLTQPWEKAFVIDLFIAAYFEDHKASPKRKFEAWTVREE